MQSDSTLRITDLREEDSAEYKFRFRTDQTTWEPTFPGTTLTVTGLQVKVTTATVTEGQKVTLTCHTTCTLTDNPNPTYIWYKNGHVTNQSNSLFLNPVSSEDAGSYSCAVEGHEDLPSAEETLTVTYGPKNTSVSVSPSGEIVEGSSVTLTCSSDANPPVDKYTWYKKNVTSPKASGQRYSITNIISEDRGEYYCEAQNGRGSMNSTALMIVVAGHPQQEVMPQQTHSVHPDPNSDTYTALNMKTRSPEYDTLANVRDSPTVTIPQIDAGASDYEN
ncbi:B-cell receptor CD22-like [Salvelinus namaycush]|uniref:B-cell receptor CD22-like n=1 Tax=Salvelinus namaycush TaxID=8040 RepID=A0A8U0Q2I4_SALNM|nr:B-cell receptor CD22-like [Salvelinus namaycush]